MLIVDETGFVKKGEKSCGVGTQYTGAVGGTANAQVGVFLAYASAKGTAFVDRALYLPRAWTHDPARRAEAGVPDGVRFATKLTLAKRLLARAFAAGVPARWVAGDAAYGRSHAFRRWLEARGRAYALSVPLTHAVSVEGRRQTAAKWAAALPGGGVAAPLRRDGRAGRAGGRLGVPAPGGGDRPGLAALAAGAPLGGRPRRRSPSTSPTGPRARRRRSWCGSAACGGRWRRGSPRRRARSGLDQYEVRTWTAWHRFVTLALLAHAYLAVTRLAASRDEAAEKGGARIPA